MAKGIGEGGGSVGGELKDMLRQMRRGTGGNASRRIVGKHVVRFRLRV